MGWNVWLLHWTQKRVLLEPAQATLAVASRRKCRNSWWRCGALGIMTKQQQPSRRGFWFIDTVQPLSKSCKVFRSYGQCHVVAFSKNGNKFLQHAATTPSLPSTNAGSTWEPSGFPKNISHPLFIHWFIQWKSIFFRRIFGKKQVEQDPFSRFPFVAKLPGGFSPDPGDPTTSYRCHLFGTACQLWTDGYQEPCGWATRRATKECVKDVYTHKTWPPGTSWDLNITPVFDVLKSSEPNLPCFFLSSMLICRICKFVKVSLKFDDCALTVSLNECKEWVMRRENEDARWFKGYNLMVWSTNQIPTFWWMLPVPGLPQSATGIRSVSIQVYPSRWDCRLGEVMFCVMMASPRSSNWGNPKILVFELLGFCLFFLEPKT